MTQMQASVVVRENNVSETIINGDEASNIPISGTIDVFRPQNIDVMNNINVSVNPSARVYVGYGIFDEHENNCIYIDAKPSDGSNIKTGFDTFKIFNGHTYGISKTKMSLTQCQSQTAKYFGYPAVITTKDESNALNSFYAGKPFWQSISRSSCTEPYRGKLNREQLYFSWPYNNEPVCDPSKLKLIANGSSTWSPATGGEANYCLVEFDTPDYEHPIKSCAPWWTVERTFKAPQKSIYTVKGKDENGNEVEFDIRSINQKDYPMTAEVCVQLDDNASANSTAGTTTVICNSYYDIRRSPRCTENIKQDVCFVNECRGTVKNTCELIDSSSAPLEYAKMTILVDGVAKVVKGKDGIKMNKYQCPALTESSGCLKSNTVSMLPQVCPGSNLDANGVEQKPIKVYGNPGIPGKYENGVLKALYGVCPDGTKVEVPINIYRQVSRTCQKYDMITTNETTHEMCSLNRPYSDYTVDTSITSEDAYANNQNCARLNDTADARPHQDILIDYSTKGFANIEIVKAQMEGRAQDVSPTVITSNYYSKVITDGAYRNSKYTASLDKNTNNPPPANLAECSDYQNGEFLINYLLPYAQKSAKGVYDYSSGDLIKFGSITKATCQDRLLQYPGGIILWGANDFNQTDINNKNNQYESLYGLISKTGLVSSDLIQQNLASSAIDTCVIAFPLKRVTGDVFSTLSLTSGATIDDTQVLMRTTAQVNYTECRRLAACTMSDVINTNRYAGTQFCTLNKTATSGDAAWTEINDEVMATVPKSTSKSTSAQSDLDNASVTGELPIYGVDGVNDIFAVIEYTDFAWGYYSSYSARNYTSNIVRANGLIVNPMIPHPRIRENIFENYHWVANSYRNFKLPKGVAITLGVGESGGTSDYGGETELISLMSGGSLAPLAYTVALFADKPKSFKMLDESEVYNRYNLSAYRYTPNANLNYETRYVGPNKLGQQSIMYSEFSMGLSDKVPDSSEGSFFAGIRDIKKSCYEELNIDMSAYTWPRHEKSLPIGYPGCKWYDPWCKAENSGAEGWALLTPTTTYHKRTLTSHYFGATNSVTLVVPYIGDYEIEGYDKLGQKIGSSKVFESAFTGGTTKMKNAQVTLASSMQIAPGIIGGDPCLADTMVEIGGGVQGPYYELGDTGTYNNFKCGRANYEYTKEHAITELTIRALNSESSFRIKLPKPLPYPNRVFVATMGLSEDREYRCFGEFGDCTGYESRTEAIQK